MKKISVVSILIIISFFSFSCDPTLKPATGLEDEIYVVADSSEYVSLEAVLDSTFEKLIYTPQPEKLFTLKRITVEELDKFKKKKNILIVAPLNSASNTSKFINAIIDSSVKNEIMSNDEFFPVKNNLWAKEQIVSIVSAPDMDKLISKIKKIGDNILYNFQKASDKRLFSSLYKPRFERKNIEGKLLKKYGWVIYVQADYQVAKDTAEDHFVWIRRSPGSDMERWIFVTWIDNGSPQYLTPDSIKAIRNRMTEKYYRTTDERSFVIIAEDYFTTTEVNFNNRYAILTQGLWELNSKGMGGPFINYTFFDEKTNRIYMLDGSVYAPKYFKRNLIQQMDVTLQSFMTEAELSKDRKKDLLNAADEE